MNKKIMIPGGILAVVLICFLGVYFLTDLLDFSSTEEPQNVVETNSMQQIAAGEESTQSQSQDEADAETSQAEVQTADSSPVESTQTQGSENNTGENTLTESAQSQIMESTVSESSASDSAQVQESVTASSESTGQTSNLRFRSKKLLENHYQKHGIEMGFSSAKEYEKAAAAVVSNPDALHKTEKEDGDDIYTI